MGADGGRLFVSFFQAGGGKPREVTDAAAVPAQGLLMLSVGEKGKEHHEDRKRLQKNKEGEGRYGRAGMRRRRFRLAGA